MWKRVGVHQVLERIRVFLQPLAQQKTVGIATDCDPVRAAVADDELLRRMLQNLVLTAVRESSKEGTVRLSGQVAGGDV